MLTSSDSQRANLLLRDELQLLIDAVEQECEQIQPEQKQGMSLEEVILLRDGKRSDRVAQFRDELLSMPDRFSRIFLTENGSTYFILSSGDCFRIQRRDISKLTDWFDHPTLEYVIMPILGDVRFVDGQEMTRIIEKGSERWGRFVVNGIEGEQVRLSALERGMHPVEFHSPVGSFIHSTQAGIKHLLFEHEVVMNHSHIGHQISEIIK